jgi:choline monooxygenase
VGNPEGVETKPQYPLAPSMLDAKNYRDPQQFERELHRVFFRSWLPVFPSSDLKQVRDYVVWDRLRQSVVIARQDDGTLSAWHNVCQHRGARLLAESGNCKLGKIICPWHGFTYNLAGKVTGVPLRDSFDQRELKDLRAPAVRVTEWSGFVWLCLSEDVADLKEYLGDLWSELGWYRMERFETRFRKTLTVAANWKLVVDAFNETWHVPFTHRSTLESLMEWRDANLHIIPPHSWMTLPVRGFTEKQDPATDHRAANVCHYLAFPSTIFSCFPTHLQMWSLWPVSINETVFTAWGIVGPTPDGMSEEKWTKRNERDWQHFMNVASEDMTVINAWGTVVNSLGFRRSMFNTAEGRLTSFHQEVNRRSSAP